MNSMLVSCFFSGFLEEDSFGGAFLFVSVAKRFESCLWGDGLLNQHQHALPAEFAQMSPDEAC